MDSLTRILLQSQDNINKVNILNMLSKELRRKSTNKAQIYAQQALLLAQMLNYRQGISEALYHIGTSYFDLSSYNKSLEYYTKALKIYESLSDSKGTATTLKEIGNIYSNLGDYDKALEYYFKSMEISEKMNNKKGISEALTNIGNVYISLKYFDKALSNFESALKNFEELNEKRGIAVNLYNIGNVYEELGQFNKALIYYQKGLKVDEEVGYKYDIAESLTGIGGIYLKIGNQNKALEYYLKALDLQKSVDDKRGISHSLTGIGGIYEQTGNTKRALDYFNESLQIALQIQIKEYAKTNYEKLAILYEKNGDLGNAYQNYKLFKIYNDSIFNETRLQQISETQAKFEVQNKEKEIDFLNREKALEQLAYNNDNIRQGIIILLLVVGAILVMVLAYILYRDNSRKNKINVALVVKNEELNKAKNEIEDKSKQLQRAYNQITNSIRYAQTIQKSILPSDTKMANLLTNYFLIYRGKDIVSGDFYWVNKIENRTFIAVVDCTGHGVAGAFVSMIGHTLLNEIINQQKIFSPAEILEQLHKGVKDVLEKRSVDIPLAMEVCLCMLEPVDYDDNKMILTFAGARRPLFYIQHSEMTELKGDKKSVGFNTRDNNVFNNRCLEVQKGGMLYLTTDGYIDQSGTNLKRFGSTRFKKMLQNGVLDKTVKEQKNYFEKTLSDHQQGVSQRDDITILGVML